MKDPIKALLGDRSPIPGVLTLSEVARREKVTENTVRTWCRDGAIWPAYKVGGSWAIPHAYIVTIQTNADGTRKRGRPLGSTGSYPKGVKRPRRSKNTTAENAEGG